MMPYSKSFQAYRRIVQHEFQPSTVQQSYRKVMMRETVALLDRLLKTPEDLSKHLKQSVSAFLLVACSLITGAEWRAQLL